MHSTVGQRASRGLTLTAEHSENLQSMPGPGTVFPSQNWKFTAPVYGRALACLPVAYQRDSRR